MPYLYCERHGREHEAGVIERPYFLVKKAEFKVYGGGMPSPASVWEATR
jgi:hypothetical protein